ncbi:sugar ABC transporter permease [Bacillus sp. 3255]|uniref:carbohydrate ABC transporter permease n=1 Tax=Bacillus sp. 3255 TaxID=2817904 RepID=UPI002858B791|nr:sugar ABC transporter permease [Bacillus sp. 3255]MDR6878851.1 ABC-type sugar transport system permease subunit [Bacillus sp. 3255]
MYSKNLTNPVTARPSGANVRGQRWRSRTVEAWWAYAFLFPGLFFLGVFHLLPAAASGVISVLDWDGLGKPSFNGLGNYTDLLKDEHFVASCLHTLLFAVVSVPLSIALATLAAVALNRQIVGRSLYRTLYFIPVVTMSTAVGLIWKWLYNSDYGPINAMLHALRLPEPNWLSDPHWIMPSIVLVSVWSTLGHHMIVLLAGLQGISSSYYEAAEMDGAGRAYTFFCITSRCHSCPQVCSSLC